MEVNPWQKNNRKRKRDARCRSYAIMSPIKVSALSVVGATPAENYRIHTVVHGDTLWAIAKKYLGNGSRYKEIVNLNGLKSNVIYSGMKLKIPNK